MKKLLLSAAVLCALAAPAKAEDMIAFKPYVGFDLQRSVYSYNDHYDTGLGFELDGDSILEDGLNGGNIHIGNRFHKNFGMELGYFQTKKESRNIDAGDSIGPGVVSAADFKTDVKVHGFTLDGLGYLPLDPEERFELIGTAGVSWSKGEISLNVPGIGSDSVDDSEFGYRVGGGAQFKITDQIGIRGIARYQSADFKDVAEHAWMYSAGLNFSF